MPYEVAIPPIDSALRALLVADASLVASIASKAAAQGGGAAIYTDGTVPQGALMPYLTIGAWTQIGFHSLTPDDAGSPNGTAYGWNCTGQIKAIGQRDTELMTAMSHVFRVLAQGKRLSVAGYGSAWCDEFNLQPMFKTVLGGVTTFEVPGILRVYVSDT
jgi:hypothetical protein